MQLGSGNISQNSQEIHVKLLKTKEFRCEQAVWTFSVERRFSYIRVMGVPLVDQRWRMKSLPPVEGIEL
jgi:hypothetical protein